MSDTSNEQLLTKNYLQRHETIHRKTNGLCFDFPDTEMAVLTKVGDQWQVYLSAPGLFEWIYDHVVSNDPTCTSKWVFNRSRSPSVLSPQQT